MEVAAAKNPSRIPKLEICRAGQSNPFPIVELLKTGSPDSGGLLSKNNPARKKAVVLKNSLPSIIFLLTVSGVLHYDSPNLPGVLSGEEQNQGYQLSAFLKTH
ncbi:MAG: hypothetical protein PHO30_04785 [Candidatus Omnitrophica bacterium]|nr:hypothetical protein [Candidatus Omnitrophota bacterium]